MCGAWNANLSRSWLFSRPPIGHCLHVISVVLSKAIKSRFPCPMHALCSSSRCAIASLRAPWQHQRNGRVRGEPWSKASHSPIGQYKREMKARHLTVLSLGGRGGFFCLWALWGHMQSKALFCWCAFLFLAPSISRRRGVEGKIWEQCRAWLLCYDDILLRAALKRRH